MGFPYVALGVQEIYGQLYLSEICKTKMCAKCAIHQFKKMEYGTSFFHITVWLYYGLTGKKVDLNSSSSPASSATVSDTDYRQFTTPPKPTDDTISSSKKECVIDEWVLFVLFIFFFCLVLVVWHTDVTKAFHDLFFYVVELY